MTLLSRMKPFPLLSVLTAATAAVLLCGCANLAERSADATMPAGDWPVSGHLVIIGGSLEDENEQVYHRIRDLAGGPGAKAAILPTASGVPYESGPGYLPVFNGYEVPSAVVDITKDNPEEANNPEKAAQIAAADVVFFTGGWQERITAAFRPDAGTTPAYEAVKEVLAKGGVVAGTSAGAAMMSDPMIRWGNSEEALLLGPRCDIEDGAVCVQHGMGLFPYAITDQHFLARGRLGRLIVATEASGYPFGIGVEENSALAADLASGTTEVLGPHGALVADLRAAERDGMAWRNVRLSLLDDGDVWDGVTGAVAVAPGHEPLVPARRYTMPVHTDPWGEHVIRDVMVQLANNQMPAAELRSENFLLRMTKDEETAAYGPADQPTVLDVRLDIEPLESAAAAAQELIEKYGGAKGEVGG